MKHLPLTILTSLLLTLACGGNDTTGSYLPFAVLFANEWPEQ